MTPPVNQYELPGIAMLLACLPLRRRTQNVPTRTNNRKFDAS